MQNSKWYQRAWVIRLAKTFCIVMLSYLLSLLIVQPFALSTATLLSASDRSDFSITDYYNTVANSRKVRTLDRDIVIVNIDNSDRQEIAQLVSLLNSYKPRAIGMDVIFAKEHEGDEPLLQALNQSSHLVLAATVKQLPDTNAFVLNRESYFASAMPQHKTGIVNLPAKYEKSVIRKFPITFDIKGEEPANSFVTALVEEVDPVQHQRLVGRGKNTQYINYPSVEFRAYSPDELIDCAEEIEGKIVLLGALTDRADTHVTPIASNMSGVEIHAHALNTILNGQYIESLPQWANWGVGFFLASLIVFASLYLTNAFKGLALRLIQLMLLFVIIPIGYYFFVNYNLSIDFTYSFLMVSFSYFAFDIWAGVAGLSGYCKSAATKISQKLQSNRLAGGRTMIVLLLFALSTLTMQAQYSLYNMVGSVKIDRQGKELELAKGMKLLSQDIVTLGKDGEVEILNSIDSRIYTSVRPGKFSVLRITIDAEAHAKANSNAFKGIGVSRNDKKTEVFEDEGVVSRALVIYDPESQNMEVDTRRMGISLLHRLESADSLLSDNKLLDMKISTPTEDALSFEFFNKFSFPVYFNVLKIKDAEAGAIEISELGQPIGCYVLQPQQSLMRSQLAGLAPGERHFLLMTHHYFDIDKLLLNVEELKSSPLELPDASPQHELPVYVVSLQ